MMGLQSLWSRGRMHALTSPITSLASFSLFTAPLSLGGAVGRGVSDIVMASKDVMEVTMKDFLVLFTDEM